MFLLVGKLMNENSLKRKERKKNENKLENWKMNWEKTSLRSKHVPVVPTLIIKCVPIVGGNPGYFQHTFRPAILRNFSSTSEPS